MYTLALIDSLVGIGKAAAKKDYAEIEALIIEAQNHALELERDLVNALRENQRLQAMKASFRAA
jgi:hypothetical protein